MKFWVNVFADDLGRFEQRINPAIALSGAAMFAAASWIAIGTIVAKSVGVA